MLQDITQNYTVFLYTSSDQSDIENLKNTIYNNIKISNT